MEYIWVYSATEKAVSGFDRNIIDEKGEIVRLDITARMAKDGVPYKVPKTSYFLSLVNEHGLLKLADSPREAEIQWSAYQEKRKKEKEKVKEDTGEMKKLADDLAKRMAETIIDTLKAQQKTSAKKVNKEPEPVTRITPVATRVSK